MNAPPRPIERPLGTMVAYGFEKGSVHVDLDVADRLGATVLEILPDWSRYPDPRAMRQIAADRGFRIHSAHACWGGQSIRAPRVDLGSTNESTWDASLDDLKRCADWLTEAGGTHLVVHPGGLSDRAEEAARREALGRGLLALSEHAIGLTICVENMPPGVHPGSRMHDLSLLVAELARPRIAVALDTGHAHMVSRPDVQTHKAGPRLGTTHVHDNDGKQDTHLPPGLGSVNWDAWRSALDAIGYRGPIMLECIRALRKEPERIDSAFLRLLADLTGRPEDVGR